MFHALAIVNYASKNMSRNKSVPYLVFALFEYILRSGIAGSYGNSTFNFLRKLPTSFRNGYNNLQYHQDCTSILFSPHFHRLVFSSFVDDNPSDRCEVSPYGFDLHFSDG